MHDSSKRYTRIEHFYGSSRTPKWLKKLQAKNLKTDAELAAFVLACRDRALLRNAVSAVDRIGSRDELLKIAASDADETVRLRALERFPRDREFLLAVKASGKSWSPTLSHMFPVETRAVEMLKAMEADAIASAADENAVADLLISGAVTESIKDALEEVKSESVLLKILNENVSPDLNVAVLGRARHPDVECGDTFKRTVMEMSLQGRFSGYESDAAFFLNDPALLSEVLDRSTSEELSRSAASELFWLYDNTKRAGKALPPLTDAQQDALVRHLATQKNLCRNLALGLLDAGHLKALYDRITDNSDRLEIVRRLPKDEFTDELMDDLLKMPGPRNRDEWQRRLSNLSTDRLIRNVREHPDWQYRVMSLEAAVGRLTREKDGTERIDALVLPLIDGIRTDNGHIGNKLVDIYRALPEKLHAHFGFEPEYEEGETIDGAEWSTLKVSYAGHQYWVYYSQTDGGGYCPPYGKQIS
ncbi:MAG: hypothetical protein II914_02830 [Clostridia bacterium]|nr:hypothetical protein [Clostridia bacterium]